MRNRLLPWLVLLASGGLMLAGCGDGPPPPEPQSSVQAANEEAAKWTPEDKEKFKEAMKGHALTARGPSSEALGKK